ncbi:helix-turn-helix transcriptional regulator [Pseudonocardia sp. TRM90224]|uniref:helix-turn-helix transcriptional regulator n=1 Tax=Pseudonocardia sp. TRM90224 TaxID=2812678 RepID=UPI0027DF5F63|nr:helix-turn-helix domain-containing protein [Pseudonocardia sp. TRM90224]
MTSRRTVSHIGETDVTDYVANRAERRHPDRLASRSEVAAYLGLPVATLSQWAYKRVGPPYRVIGKHARYRWADVDRWVAAQTSGGDAA